MNLNNWYKKSQVNNKEPWEMTQKDFLDYHYTGFIGSDAYENYKTVEGLKWLKKENYPELYDVKNFDGVTVEFRKSGEDLKYVKKDVNEDIVRDDHGMAVMLSREEMVENKLPLKDQTIVAFVGDDAIGWASNEWGATGVWVVEEYQFKGIGSYLLFEFRKTMKPTSRMGQMTDSGINLIKSYHIKLVEQALKENKAVPEEVLNDYPELKNELV